MENNHISGEYRDVVLLDGVYILIDSCKIDGPPPFKSFYETMAFLCSPEGEVTSYFDLYCEQYSTLEAMQKRHFELVNHPTKMLYTQKI